MALSPEEIERHYSAKRVSPARFRMIQFRMQGIPGKGKRPGRNRRRSIQRVRARNRLFSEFPNCYYCRIQLTKINRSLDHFIPKSMMKLNRVQLSDNLVTCCKACNNSKGSRPAEKWIEELHLSSK